MRKQEIQNLPVGLAGTVNPYIVNCPEDWQTIVHIRNTTAVAQNMAIQLGGGAPISSSLINVAGTAVAIIVLSAAVAANVAATATVIFPAYASFRLIPQAPTTWTDWQIIITHVIP